MILSYDFGEEFDYEPKFDKEQDALVTFITEDLNLTNDQINGAKVLFKELVSNNLVDIEELEEIFEDSLINYFEKEAREAYRDAKEFESDKESWFETRKNIIGR